LARQCYHRHKGGNPHWHGDEQHYASPPTALPSSYGLLPHDFLALAHRSLSCHMPTRCRRLPLLYPLMPSFDNFYKIIA
jgi:hypothetical protein